MCSVLGCLESLGCNVVICKWTVTVRILEPFSPAIIFASFLSGRKCKSFSWRQTLCIQKSRDRFISRFRPCPCFIQPVYRWCPRSIWRSCGCVLVCGTSLCDRGRCAVFTAGYSATHCCHGTGLQTKDKPAAYYCSVRFCEERHYMLGFEPRLSYSALRILYTIVTELPDEYDELGNLISCT